MPAQPGTSGLALGLYADAGRSQAKGDNDINKWNHSPLGLSQFNHFIKGLGKVSRIQITACLS